MDGYDGHVTSNRIHAPNKLLGTFYFKREGNAAAYQTGCWSTAESEHTWAMSPGCGLSIPIAQAAVNLALLIDVGPALNPPRLNTRQVSVSVGSKRVLQIEVKKRSVFLIHIGAADANSNVTIDFHFDSPECQFGSDIRPLALMFTKAFLLERTFCSNTDLSIAPSFSNIHDEDVMVRSLEAFSSTPIRDFMVRFESLGQSCDFGLFQRKCGADPLGLLRFAAITTNGLIEGLINRFDRLGNPGSLEASVNPDWNNEYMVFEAVYGMSFHTFLGPHQASPEQVLARQNLHLTFLKRVFLETLDNGEKTFVLRRPDPVQRAEVEAIVEVLRLYSCATLLWAVQDGEKIPGTVDAYSQYLFRGYLDTCETGSASIHAWLGVCLNSQVLKSLCNNL